MVSSLYPQREDGLPRLSIDGKYALRVFINGIWRRVCSR